ncbi:hypothetical protein PYW08_004570 [Mythimna loreyi]|uniref:Uncharacterized protein n=1 Tax=Mythimna loreyi TaxID=667449 RepID=A0ACC2QPU1_9NEOP|nr:hypothetical protein PYW08_004570 [Mythimna loreyi]
MDVDSARSEISARLPSVDLRSARSERALWQCGECPARSARRPASAVNELTLTNAPFGIVRGKTGGLARAPPPPPAPTNHEPSRHSLRLFWRERVV